MNAQQIRIDNAMVVWSIGARSDFQAIVDGLTALGAHWDLDKANEQLRLWQASPSD